MNNPVRQHTIPKFYLNHFAAPTKKKFGQVSVLNLDKGSAYKTSVDRATIENDRNTFIADGEPSYEFERMLRDNEGNGAEAIELARQGKWPLPFNQRRNLSYFIAAMYTRGEWLRHTQDDVSIMTASLNPEEITELYKTTSGEELTRPQAEVIQLMAQTQRNSQDRARQHYVFLQENLPKMVAIFERARWRLITLNSGFFITGDAPVVILGSELNPASIGSARSVFFPIGRENAVVISTLGSNPLLSLGAGDSMKTTGHKFSDRINKYIAIQSSSFLCAHPDDSHFLDSIPKEQYSNRLTVNIEKFKDMRGI